MRRWSCRTSKWSSCSFSGSRLRATSSWSFNRRTAFEPLGNLPQKLGSVRSFATAHDAPALPEELRRKDTFLRRHLGSDQEDIDAMCGVIGVRDVDDLIKQTVPSSITRSTPLEIHHDTQSESAVLVRLAKIASMNHQSKNFLGMGYHGTHTPSVLRRCLFNNPGWYTAYTPYQPEIAQGRLEGLLIFQTMISELTGMDIANASLLDEATAAAEAMLLCARAHKGDGGDSQEKMFFVSSGVHPQTLSVLRTRAAPMGIRVVKGRFASFDFERWKGSICGALVQYPSTFGRLRDFTDLSQRLHNVGALLCVAADPLALTIARPPGEMRADIVVGSAQRFGVPMGFGGPHAGFFATRQEHVRRMPGRIIGVSIDSHGDRALRMALQTREQHIRRDKATSNVCTAQALLANMAGMYGVWHGPEGLRAIAKRVRGLAAMFARGIVKAGWEVENIAEGNFFDTVVFNLDPLSPDEALHTLATRGIDIRILDPARVSATFDETHTMEDVKALLRGLAAAADAHVMPTDSLISAVHRVQAMTQDDSFFTAKTSDIELPSELQRETPFMQQPIFSGATSEMEMMRFLKKLEEKDLTLNRSMIPLGSCTMKLNPSSSIDPIVWEGFSNLHPFAPAFRTAGYRQLVRELARWLKTITGFEACSLQPNSGAAGEYAGLLAIRGYLSSLGEAHRDIALIPRSAHGTNPASAVLAGMRIRLIDSDSKGNIDLEHLKKVATECEKNLACLMITYPSTHGVFESNVKEICRFIHDKGGQVYMDGANMNAQLGLTSPAEIGADVCHLNLHKTFAIPHGGGGPGVGPVCAKEHLRAFLPYHFVRPLRGSEEGGPVAGAPFGSAMILPISYSFIAMLGGEGLKRSAEVAILNANYMLTRLQKRYAVKFTGDHGRCAHEFILDVEPLKKSAGVTEEDIAKRLIDYGFHAPTMSWPVQSALMIEPTESESKDELDRFCDAMLSIREEIEKIEKGQWPRDDNPLKNAPHTMRAVCADEWRHPYTRQEAAFPLPYIAERGKFWPSVGRVDNPHGDRHLVCQCDEAFSLA